MDVADGIILFETNLVIKYKLLTQKKEKQFWINDIYDVYTRGEGSQGSSPGAQVSKKARGLAKFTRSYFWSNFYFVPYLCVSHNMILAFI